MKVSETNKIIIGIILFILAFAFLIVEKDFNIFFWIFGIIGVILFIWGLNGLQKIQDLKDNKINEEIRLLKLQREKILNSINKNENERM